MQIGHEVTIELFTCPKRMMKGTVVAQSDNEIVVLISNCLHITFVYPTGEQSLTPIGEDAIARGERALKGPIGRVTNWHDNTHIDDDIIAIELYQDLGDQNGTR